MKYTLEKIGISRELTVGGHSLVGVGGLYYPLSYGNYFSVKFGTEYFNIINMNMENFKHLKDTEWTIYNVIDEDGEKTKGFILYNDSLSLDWYLKNPYLYGTKIDGFNFKLEKGMNTNISPFKINNETIGEYVNSLVIKDYKIVFTDEFTNFSDLNKDSVFLEVLSAPYTFYEYNYRHLEINLDDDNGISRIAFILDEDILYIRNQVLGESIEKIQAIYDFKEFEKKIKTLTKDGVKHYFELSKDGQ